jgi:hypothetical protein
MAGYFGMNAVRNEQRRRNKENKMRPKLRKPERGPTEEEIMGLRRELESMLPAGDRRKLHALWAAEAHQADASEPTHSERTLRRWRQELHAKYGPRLI